MRVGLFLGYWPWFSPSEHVELAQLGDELGLDSVWISEAWGQDAVSVLGLLAGKTERIGLGSGLFQIPARQPAATAMAAATLDVLSGGRFRLGLGLSGPQVSEGWYGVPFTRPLQRTREYVEIVRQALAGEPLAYAGEEWTLPLPADQGMGLGKPLKLLARPVQERIPIYLGSIGPRAVRQTGEIADGWLPFMFHPDNPGKLLDPLLEGLARAGRAREDIDVAPVVPVAVAGDVDAARESARAWLAFYLGGMGAKGKNFYVDTVASYGFGNSAHAVQDAFLAGDRAGAAAALDGAIIDQLAICTRPEDLPARIRAFSDAGADAILAVPAGPDKHATIRALAEASVSAAA